jgi:hypothetical protein
MIGVTHHLNQYTNLTPSRGASRLRLNRSFHRD